MPNVSTPSLRRHATGQFFVLWGGKTRYLGSDKSEAQSRYAVELDAWRVWREEKPKPNAKAVYQSAGMAEGAVAVAERVERVRPSAVRGATVEDAVDRLLEKIEDEASELTHKSAKSRLRWFTEFRPRGSALSVGDMPLSAISGDILISWRSSLIKHGYAPNSINPTIVLVRRVLTLATETEMAEKPFRLSLLKAVPAGAVPDKSMTSETIAALLEVVAAHKPNLARLLMLQYWCCLRPSEVSRLVYEEGEWIDDKGQPAAEGSGYYRMDSKTEQTTGQKRVVVLTPEACALLARTKRECPNQFAYRDACWKASEKIGTERIDRLIGKEHFNPHPFRHSSQTHLVQAEVADELIDCAAGHLLPKVKRVYRPQPLAATRKALVKLSALVPCPKGI
jgi:integrase